MEPSEKVNERGNDCEKKKKTDRVSLRPLYFRPHEAIRSRWCNLRNALQRFRAGHLIVDPAIGALQTITQTRRRFPVKNFPNQCVVAVASVYAFRRGEIVTPLEFQPRDVFHQIDQLIDRNELVAAK